MDKDLYKILGVKEDASDAAIKKAYRDLAKKFHPDRTGGDKSKETRFKDISAAYEVLSDPKKRQQYDMLKQGNFVGAQPGGNPFAGGGFEAGGFGGADLNDILAQMFGGAFGGGGRTGGPGRTRVRTQQTRGPQVIFESDSWGGEEQQPFRPQPVQERIVRLPDGSELTLKGNDAHGDLPLSIDQAVLGTKAEVQTMSGRVTLTIPPGTSSGMKLRLRGKGPDGGDQYMTVQIRVPKDIPDKAKELIAEFAKLTKGKAKK
jgi:curved DNA-binding protein